MFKIKKWVSPKLGILISSLGFSRTPYDCVTSSSLHSFLSIDYL